MENYNLTAEIKKISGAINNSSPNTELGNINSGVGNLDTAVQGVSTAINGLSIPNTGFNIDGVATAINNKTIPDNTSNITAVANAIVAMAGGKDLDDLIAILTTMNGNIANLGTNHITSITADYFEYIAHYGGGAMVSIPNESRYCQYTDNNNIGATDVQGAVDSLSKFDTFTSTSYDTSILDAVVAQRRGNIISVRLNIKGGLTASTWFNGVATGLPVEWRPTISIPFIGCRIGSAQDLGKTCSGAIESNGNATFIEGGLTVGHEVYVVYVI